MTGETRAQILDVVKLLEAYRLLAVAGLVWFIIAFVRGARWSAGVAGIFLIVALAQALMLE